MKVTVCGRWHMGRVFASYAAHLGHQVILYDTDLGSEIPDEPGLLPVVMTSDPATAMHNTSVLWIAWDTPILSDDRGDVDWVMSQARALYPFVHDDLVLVSSQIPVGTTERMRDECGSGRWFYVPENLRLGNAVQSFAEQKEIIIGGHDDLSNAWNFFKDKDFIPMSIRSAEMSKHAINAFLATQIALTNELAWLAEDVGADARSVEKALRAEPRIGRKAYVRAGASFAGGTLGRDLQYLVQMHAAQCGNIKSCLPERVLKSNDTHQNWIEMQLDFADSVAIWGISYKGSTNTKRASRTEQYIKHLFNKGVDVRAYEHGQPLENMLATLDGADALLLGNEHPSYREVAEEEFLTRMRHPVVVDPGSYLHFSEKIDHRCVGMPRGA